MRRLLVLLLACAPLLAADDAEVRRLIAQLGADEPAAREEASKALAKLGDEDEGGSVERLLEEATHSSDAEVVSRAKAALAHIRFWEHIVVLGGDEAGAVDLLTGECAWSRPQSSIAWARPHGHGAFAFLLENERGSVGAALECLELRTGRTRWKADVPAWGEVSDGTHWLGYGGCSLARLSLESGEKEWAVELPKPIARVRPASIAEDATGVYVETQEGLLALDAATGKERWRGAGTLLGLVRGGVYVRRSKDGRTGRLVRLDPMTGGEAWSRSSAPEHRPERLFDGGEKEDLVLFVDGPEVTTAVHAATGKDAWDAQIAASAVWVDPEGTQAWAASPSAVVAVDLASGRTLHRIEMASELDQVSLCADGGTLYMVRYEGISCAVALDAIDWKARKELWTADVQGVEVDHSRYWQRARVEQMGGRLLFIVESAGGNSIEVVDRATGKVTQRIQPK